MSSVVISQLRPEQMRYCTAEQTKAMSDWARANGLDPNDISATFLMTVEQRGPEQVIRYQTFVLDARGRKQVRPDRDEVWLEERTAPLVVPMPESWG